MNPGGQRIPPCLHKNKNLPPYLFARIDEMKAKKRAEGVDVIDLGVGDPDLCTPPHIVNALIDAAKDPDNHHYPSYLGLPAYRQAVAGWYNRRFGVDLDPDTQVISLMGSKDGVAHIPEALTGPGDYVLVPSPGYPVYSTGALFAEASTYEMPLARENDFLPDLDAIPKDIAKKAISIIKKLVKAGKISEERIEESYNRIMELKKKMLNL